MLNLTRKRVDVLTQCVNRWTCRQAPVAGTTSGVKEKAFLEFIYTIYGKIKGHILGYKICTVKTSIFSLKHMF